MFNAPVNLSSHSDSSHAATAPTTAFAGEIGKPQAQPSRWGEQTRQKMLAYVQRNRDDLTIEEAAAKFGLSFETARRYLSALAGSGQLERVSVYRLPEGR